jgi:hypothetical protein
VIWPLRSIRLAFALAVAFLGAATGDAVLEGISNAGLLWRGHYTDNSSVDLLPMLCVAAVALGTTLVLMVRTRMRRSRSCVRALLASASRALSLPMVARLLPAIFALQLLALFLMETCEQVAVYGHPLGGSLWLGAPVLASLFLHGAFAAASAFGLASFVTACAERIVRVVRRFRDCLGAAARPNAAVLRARPVSAAEQLFRIAHLAQRAPPAPAVV